MFGKQTSEETKIKLRAALSGANNPFYGRTHSEETKAQLSASKKGIPTGRSWNKGLTKENDSRVAKIAQSLKGHSSWCKGLTGIFVGPLNPMYGVEPWNKGKNQTAEHCEKIRQSVVRSWAEDEERRKPQNNPCWLGGKSYEPYGLEFNEHKKNEIKQRDGWACSLCNEGYTEVILHVHHIDYDKTNNANDNLITLCNACHNRTNFNRSYWQAELESR